MQHPHVLQRIWANRSILLTLKVLLGVTTVVAVFALVTSSIERNAIERHEQTFNDQQHVQTRIAAQGFKQSLSDLDSTIRGALRAITPSRLVSSPRANAPELLSILRGSPLVAGMALLPADGAPLLLGEAEPGTRLHAFRRPLSDGLRPTALPLMTSRAALMLHRLP